MIRSILGHVCVGYRPARPVTLPKAPWVLVEGDRMSNAISFDIDLDRNEWREIPAHVAADALKGGAA